MVRPERGNMITLWFVIEYLKTCFPGIAGMIEKADIVDFHPPVSTEIEITLDTVFLTCTGDRCWYDYSKAGTGVYAWAFVPLAAKYIVWTYNRDDEDEAKIWIVIAEIDREKMVKSVSWRRQDAHMYIDTAREHYATVDLKR